MPLRQMTAQQLQGALAAEEGARPLLLDVRENWEWQLVHIAGSRHMPMGLIASQAAELDKLHPTVVICHHGTRSLQVVAFLERMGFSNLHNLQGGIDAWARAIDRTLQVY